MKRLQLDDDGHCFACGKRNPRGLQLDFRNENGRTAADFLPHKEHQGFKDIVHGGIIATVLDEAMVKAALSTGIQAVTAELTVRFKSPLLTWEYATVMAELSRPEGRVVETSARMLKRDGTLVAEARAKLLRNE
ncbi:MAG: PaaI family thioesterase [Candidatus Sulfobium sp.]|jgi:acyl-coenzyme A thioesterase PaaI-like protein